VLLENTSTQILRTIDYKTYSQHLEYLKKLIIKGQLSSPKDLSEKFECNERTVRKMINDLRDSGMDIKYSRKKNEIFYSIGVNGKIISVYYDIIVNEYWPLFRG
jgi:biotin operon repressor